MKCVRKTIRKYYKINTFNFIDFNTLQEFTVPANCTSIKVDCVAAPGRASGSQGSSFGYGGRVQTTLAVTPGQILYFFVGSRSGTSATYNASDIRTDNTGVLDSTSLQSRLVVAGGGGSHY